MNCLIRTSKDFTELQSKTGVNPDTLETIIGVMQWVRGSDFFPTALDVAEYMKNKNSKRDYFLNELLRDRDYGEQKIEQDVVVVSFNDMSSISDDHSKSTSELWNHGDEISATNLELLKQRSKRVSTVGREFANIKNNIYARPIYKVIGMILDKFKDSPYLNRNVYYIHAGSDTNLAGFYANGDVFINMDSKKYILKSMRPYLLAHELVHAVTRTFLSANPQFRESIVEYIRALKTKRSNEINQLRNGDWEDTVYALMKNDANEFIAEFYTSNSFRGWLKGVRSLSINGMFTAFKEILGSIIGHVFGLTSHDSAFSEVEEGMNAILDMAAKDSMNSTFQNFEAEGERGISISAKREFGFTKDLDEAIANANIADAVGTHNVEKHLYVKNGIEYMSVTTAMTKYGIKSDYDDKYFDPKRPSHQSLTGSAVHTILEKYAIARAKGMRTDTKGYMKDIKDDELVSAVSLSGGIKDSAMEMLATVLDNAFGAYDIIKHEGNLFSTKGRNIAGRYDIKIMDENGISTTVDLKTTVKKHTDKDGNITIGPTRGFDSYKKAYDGNLSREQEHAVQLFTYRRLDLQNGTQTDKYSVLLLELETRELPDGTIILDKVTLGGPSKNDTNVGGLVNLKETVGVHDYVLKVTGESSQIDNPMDYSFKYNGNTVSISDVIDEIFPGISEDRKYILSFEDILKELSNRYDSTKIERFKDYHSRILMVASKLSTDRDIIAINEKLDSIHRRVSVAKRALSSLGFSASASGMAARQRSIEKSLHHYDTLSKFSFEEIALQINVILSEIERFKSSALITEMSDAEVFRKINSLIIKLEAYKDLEDIANFLNGNDSLWKHVNDYFLAPTREVEGKNIEDFDAAAETIKGLSATMRGVMSNLEDIRKKRFATYLANSSFSYEEFKKEELRKIHAKTWVKNNPGKDARKDPNFKKESREFIDSALDAEMSSGDYQKNKIQWFMNLMENAEFDSNFILAYTQAIQNNPDPITSTVSFAYNDIQLKKDKAQRGFVVGLEKTKKALYEKFGYSTTSDPRDIYSFMIEFPEKDVKKRMSTKLFKRNIQGLNATIVQTPEQAFNAYIKDFKTNLYNSGLKEEDILRKVAAEVEKYASISTDDLSAVRSDLITYYEDLLKNKQISQNDFDTLVKIESLNHSELIFLYKYVKRGELSEDTVEMIEDVRTRAYSSIRKYSSELTSDKYRQIQEWKKVDPADPRVQMFEYISNKIDELDYLMPHDRRLGNNLPGVTKRMQQSFLTGDMHRWFGLLWNKLRLKADKSSVFKEHERLSKTSDMNGYSLESIPVYYLNAVDSEEQSYDIPQIFGMWHEQANGYIHDVGILPILEYTAKTLNERSVPEIDSKGQLIANKALSNIGEKVKSKNAIRSSNNFTAKQFIGWLDSKFYRKRDASRPEWFTEIMGHFQWLTTQVGLNMNIPANVLNAIQAELQNIYKVTGGRWITAKTLTAASKEYAKNVHGIIGDWNAIQKKNIINLMSEEFGIMPDQLPQSSHLNNRLVRANILDMGFYGQEIGEHAMQMRFAIAFFMGIEAISADGNSIGNLYDNFYINDNGEFSVKGAVRKVKIGDRTMDWGGNAKNLLSTKLNYLLQSMHGNYHSHTKALADADALTRPLMAFRRWISSTTEAMYAGWNIGAQYHPYADEVKVGRLTSFRNYVWNKHRARAMEFADTMNWIKSEEKRLELRQKILDLKNSSNSAYMADMDEANIQETYAAMSVAAAITALAAASSMLLAERKKRRAIYGTNESYTGIGSLEFIQYILYRAKMEAYFYVNPFDAFQIIRTPIPGVNVMEQYMDLLKLSAPWRWGETYEGGKYHGQNKLKHKAARTLPAIGQLSKVSHMDERLRALGID